MFAYVIMYVVVLIAFLNKEKRILGEIAFFILLFCSLFRGDLVGIDTQGAMSWHQVVNRGSLDFDLMDSRTYEVTTNFIYKLIYFYNFPERIIIIFYSLVTFMFLRSSSARMNIDIATLAIIFLLGGAYIYSFNIARQYAGIAVSIYAITYIFEKKSSRSLLFFLFMLFATTIHTSSLIYFPLYLFRFLDFKKSVVYIITLIIIFFSLVGVLNIRSLMSKVLSINLMSSYSEYYSQNLNLTQTFSFGGYIIMYTQLLLQLLMLNKVYDKFKYSLLFAFVILVSYMTNDISGDISRSFFGFKFLVMLFVGYYLSKFNNLYLKSLFIVAYSYSFYKGIMDPYYFCF